ncbi:MAG: hypothetical protein ACKV19_09060, partial [Verrucomicrobiales bacterium]
MNHIRHALLCALCVSCFGPLASAAEFFPVVNVTSTTQDSDLWPVANLIQGPGVGFSDTEPHDQLGAGDQSRWVTAACGFPCDYLAGAEPPVIILDLEVDTDLAEISVWGYTTTNTNGVKEFKLRFATNAEGEGGFGTSITYNPTFPVDINDAVRQSFVFDRTVRARYVEFTCTDNHFVAPGDVAPNLGGDRVGLGEIAFERFTAPPFPNLVAPANLVIPPTREVTDASVTLQNTGALPLTISATTLSGPNAGAFAIISSPSTLNSLQSGNVQLRFTPGALLGDVAATLTVASNDPDLPSVDIPITTSVPAPPPPRVEFFPIVNVTSSTQDSDLFPVVNLIQGSGEGFAPDTPYDQLGGGITHRWVTAACGYPCDYLASNSPPVIILDLGENRSLVEIDVWGYTATNDNGVKEFQLRFATAAEGEAGFGTSITYTPTFLFDENNDIRRFLFPFGRSVLARYVEFTCTDNFFVDPGTAGGDRMGLGEIAFPTTATGTAAPPLAITAVQRNAATRALTLTFTSEVGKTYTIKRSSNLAAWIDLANGVPSTGA